MAYPAYGQIVLGYVSMVRTSLRIAISPWKTPGGAPWTRLGAGAYRGDGWQGLAGGVIGLAGGGGEGVWPRLWDAKAVGLEIRVGDGGRVV